MSEFKGTPGPWYMEKGKDDGWIIAKNDALVCMMNSGLTRDEMSETERRDADLIMAAPDLLECLIELRQWISQEIAQPNSPCGRADTAIAKALGEEK